MPEKNGMFVLEPQAKKSAEQDDELFKGLEPTYVAPKTVSYKEAGQAESSKRFEMDHEEAGDWVTDELSFDK